MSMTPARRAELDAQATLTGSYGLRDALDALDEAEARADMAEEANARHVERELILHRRAEKAEALQQVEQGRAENGEREVCEWRERAEKAEAERDEALGALDVAAREMLAMGKFRRVVEAERDEARAELNGLRVLERAVRFWIKEQSDEARDALDHTGWAVEAILDAIDGARARGWTDE